MTSLRSSQLADIAVGSGGAHIRSSQLAIVAVAAPPAAAYLASSQLAMVCVISNGRNTLALGLPYRLPCWQPCTAYGTRSIVIRIK